MAGRTPIPSTAKPDTDSSSDTQAQTSKSAGLGRYFRVSLLCTLATAFFVLASTGRLDKPAVMLFSVALLARLVILAWRSEWYLSAKLVTFLSVAYLAFYPLDLAYLAPGSTLPDRMLIATIHLALFASAIKVLSASRIRDHFYLALLSFVMMLAAAILTVAAVYIAGFCLYVLFAISTLLSYEVMRLRNQPQESHHLARTADPTDACHVRSVEVALGKMALGLLLVLVPLAALLFFVIPRYRSGYLWRTGLEAQRISGFSEAVDLGDIGRILRSNQVVMRVTPEGDARSLEGEKLRGVALAIFDGKRWYNADRVEHALAPVSIDVFRPPDYTGLAIRPGPVPLRYRVLLEPLSTSVLFLAGRPKQIDAHLRFMLSDRNGSLLDPLHIPGPFAYDVIAESGFPSARQLRATSPAVPDDIGSIYLGLPRLDPRVAQLARQVTAGKRNNYDRAVSLETYLQNHFTYTLDLDEAKPADPVANFLFQTKRGNCEFFAASMAVMLRSLGIASRLVNGFQMGAYNPVGKDFVVRGYDAHSWVEVYFAGRGWVPFDPTPSGPDSGAFGLLEGYLDAAQLFWNEWVVNYDAGRQVHLAASVESTSRDVDRGFREMRWRFERLTSGRLAEARDWLSRHRINTLALVIILLALATLVVRHPAWIEDLRAALAWRLAARKGANPSHAASLAYKRFLVALARRGIEKGPADTALEFAKRIEDAGLREPAMGFTVLYQEARFGHGRVTPEALETALDAALKVTGRPIR